VKSTLVTLARAALAFGLLFGLLEGALLIEMQRGSSSWPIALGVGPAAPWYSAAVDALLAVAIALLVAGVATAVVRLKRSADVLLLALLVAGATFLLVRINNRWSHASAASIALAVGLAYAAIAWRRAQPVVVELARLAPPTLLAVALIAVALELAPRWRDARARAALPPAPANARSVLVVVWDTVRPDHLSCCGYRRETSPRLDALAAQGARFGAAFSTSSWTLPSHASMLTGRLPREHGAGFEPLDATWPTLGEEFTKRGWRSAAFSGNLCYFTRRNGFGRGFSTFDDVEFSVASRLLRTLAARELLGLADPARANGDERLRRDASDVNRAFLEWLDRAPERPFFAFLNYFDAHAPYRPPQRIRGSFAAAEGTAKDAGGDPLARDAALYDECILHCDRSLEQLLDELARRRRLDDTVVVVLSDHGESFGEGGARYHRGSLQREQSQVAWIVRAPGRVAPGTVVESVTSLVALPATLLELANAGDAGPFPAPSLVPLLVDGATSGGSADEGEAIAELARHPWPEYRDKPCYSGSLRSIVKGPWHLVRHSTLGVTLFDRVADPREEHDLHAQRPAIAAALARELDASLARATAHADPFADDPELASRQDLAGLGYVAGDGH
jgi:arylsulfatase A-like enzyme